MSIWDYRQIKVKIKTKKIKFKGEKTMKKLALVLGSLLVVGSVASAKEVMPAPAPAPYVRLRGAVPPGRGPHPRSLRAPR